MIFIRWRCQSKNSWAPECVGYLWLFSLMDSSEYFLLKEEAVKEEPASSSEERSIETLGSSWWRISNGGRIFRMSRFKGINLQSWLVWESAETLGEKSPLGSLDNSFRPLSVPLKKKLLMLRQRVTIRQKRVYLYPVKLNFSCKKIWHLLFNLFNLQGSEGCCEWSCCAWTVKRANCQARELSSARAVSAHSVAHTTVAILPHFHILFFFMKSLFASFLTFFFLHHKTHHKQNPRLNHFARTFIHTFTHKYIYKKLPDSLKMYCYYLIIIYIFIVLLNKF